MTYPATYADISAATRATMRAARTQLLDDIGVCGLLAKPDANPKLEKNQRDGILTAPLHLAPARLSGHNVCARATPGCIAGCLHTAGNPAHMKGKERARILKTKAFFAQRNAFMQSLVVEIAALETLAKKRGFLNAAVRLNATSDIKWESMPVTLPDGKQFKNLMQAFPRVQFYDYSKISNRHDLPKNYHLTFSLAENNDSAAIAWYERGYGRNVAVVFDVPRGKPLPNWYQLGRHIIGVIDGDESDYRPFDPRGVIVGLRAKGKARGDQSGFVRPALLF